MNSNAFLGDTYADGFAEGAQRLQAGEIEFDKSRPAKTGAVFNIHARKRDRAKAPKMAHADDTEPQSTGQLKKKKCGRHVREVEPWWISVGSQ
jgi:hypothetical protein